MRWHLMRVNRFEQTTTALAEFRIKIEVAGSAGLLMWRYRRARSTPFSWTTDVLIDAPVGDQFDLEGCCGSIYCSSPPTGSHRIDPCSGSIRWGRHVDADHWCNRHRITLHLQLIWRIFLDSRPGQSLPAIPGNAHTGRKRQHRRQPEDDRCLRCIRCRRWPPGVYVTPAV